VQRVKLLLVIQQPRIDRTHPLALNYENTTHFYEESLFIKRSNNKIKNLFVLIAKDKKKPTRKLVGFLFSIVVEKEKSYPLPLLGFGPL